MDWNFENWPTEVWITIIFGILATLGIPVTVWATRQWGNRKRRARFRCIVIPLIPKIREEYLSHLELSYKGMSVPDPHLVTLSIENLGPWDISSGHFDGGRPVIMSLDCPLYGVVSNSDPDNADVSAPGNTTEIKVSPKLIQTRDIITIRVITSGSPKFGFSSTLIDTHIICEPERDRPLTPEEQRQRDVFIP